MKRTPADVGAAARGKARQVLDSAKVGIFVASLISGAVGALVLLKASAPRRAREP